MRYRLALAVMVVATLAGGWAAAAAPIKSLSPEEITALQEGRGFGQGRAAEFNHYPGPTRVLDLGDELGLAPDQIDALSAIEQRVRAEAAPLGAKLLEQERNLEATFAHATAGPDAIAELSGAIAESEGRLLALHLTAHLQTRALLTAEQLARYDYLQGYSDALTALVPRG